MSWPISADDLSVSAKSKKNISHFNLPIAAVRTKTELFCPLTIRLYVIKYYVVIFVELSNFWSESIFELGLCYRAVDSTVLACNQNFWFLSLVCLKSLARLFVLGPFESVDTTLMRLWSWISSIRLNQGRSRQPLAALQRCGWCCSPREEQSKTRFLVLLPQNSVLLGSINRPISTNDSVPAPIHVIISPDYLLKIVLNRHIMKFFQLLCTQFDIWIEILSKDT